MGRRGMIREVVLPIAVLAALATAPAGAAEPRHITFDEAIEIALVRNSALERAANAATLDRTAVSRATLRFLPDLRLSASGSESYDHSASTASGDGVVVGAAAGKWSESFSAGLTSSVVLFDGLANLAELRAVRLLREAGLHDIERTRQTVAFQVITGYLTMIAAGEQARVREENLAAQEEQERLVRALVEGGARPISDLYQQQANVAAARLSRVEARRGLELSRIDLVQALQLDPAGEYVFEAPLLPEGAGEAVGLELSVLLERAFARRSDLSALAAELGAADHSLRAAKGGRWPTVSLGADYRARYSGAREDGFLDQLDEHRSGSIGLSVSLPLFDRLDTQQGIERASIEADNTALALADLRQAVALQVRRAVLDQQAAREALQAAEAQVRAARQALEATHDRYDVGAATLYEVTLARADLVAATSSRVNARYSLLWQQRLLDYYVGDLDPEGGLGPAGDLGATGQNL